MQIPIQYIEALMSFVTHQRGDAQRIRLASGLQQNTPWPATVSDAAFFAALSIAVDHALPGRPVSLQLLEHLPVASHGMVGVLAMTAPVMSQALDIALEFAPVSMPLMSLEAQPTTALGRYVRVEPVVDLGPWSALLIELTIGAFRQIAPYVPDAQPCMLVDLAHSGDHLRETDLIAYRTFFGSEPRFNQPCSGFMVLSDNLNVVLTSGQATTHAQLRSVVQGGPWAAPANLWLERARHIVFDCITRGVVPQLEHVASELAVSARTLRRRLSEAGAGFGPLVDDARLQYAQTLLLHTDLRIEQVAKKSGFADASTFSRSFRRGTGMTPANYRRSAAA
jgi:AraC-like DNA-binding protein